MPVAAWRTRRATAVGTVATWTATWIAIVLLTPAAWAVDPWVHLGATSPGREEAAVKAWIAEATEILKSPAFEQNLRALPSSIQRIYLRAGDLGSRDDLANIVTLKRAGLRVVPSPLALVGGTHDATATAGWTGDPFGDGDSSTSVSLGRAHLKRWLSGNAVTRSCAINTMSHELSHLISTDAVQLHHALTDTGQTAPAGAVQAIGSYLVGTTAQCTWLAKHMRIKPQDVTACVAVFGTLNFNSDRCEQFDDSEPVVERTGLYPPAPPAWKSQGGH